MTAVFRAEGITIDQLMVNKISDIVLIHGHTSNVPMGAERGRFATDISAWPSLFRSFPDLLTPRSSVTKRASSICGRSSRDACLSLYRWPGLVRLRGHVERREQADFAVSILSRIDRVSAVHSDLVAVTSKD